MAVIDPQKHEIENVIDVMNQRGIGLSNWSSQGEFMYTTQAEIGDKQIRRIGREWVLQEIQMPLKNQ